MVALTVGHVEPARIGVVFEGELRIYVVVCVSRSIPVGLVRRFRIVVVRLAVAVLVLGAEAQPVGRTRTERHAVDVLVGAGFAVLTVDVLALVAETDGARPKLEAVSRVESEILLVVLVGQVAALVHVVDCAGGAVDGRIPSHVAPIGDRRVVGEVVEAVEGTQVQALNRVDAVVEVEHFGLDLGVGSGTGELGEAVPGCAVSGVNGAVGRVGNQVFVLLGQPVRSCGRGAAVHRQIHAEGKRHVLVQVVLR